MARMTTVAARNPNIAKVNNPANKALGQVGEEAVNPFSNTLALVKNHLGLNVWHPVLWTAGNLPPSASWFKTSVCLRCTTDTNTRFLTMIAGTVAGRGIHQLNLCDVSKIERY